MSEMKETEYGLVNAEWTFIPSTVFCKNITDGTHDSPKQQKEGKHLITSKHIKERNIDFDNAYCISEADFDKINQRSKVDQWDVIISMIGEYCGFCYVERNSQIDYAVKNVGIFKTASENKAFWLYYFLNSKIGKHILDANKSGTSQPYLTLGFLRELPILYPKNDNDANRILIFLRSLDDKLDLLERQNKTIEKLAETLFRQWFIEEAEDSWEEKRLDELGRIICGKTPSKKNHSYFNGSVPFIKIPDMHGKTFLFETEDSLTEKGAISQTNKYLPSKSICVSCIATVGLVSMNVFPSQTNQQINSIIPFNGHYRYFLFLKMKSMKCELLAMASGGTATDNLNTGNFSKINIQVPDENMLIRFNDNIEPLFNKVFSNTKQIQTLNKLRDTLLPKLMSGEASIINNTKNETGNGE